MSTFPAFAGNEACQECHPQVVENYARSGMANSWASLTAEHPAASLFNGHTVTDAKSGFTYSPEKDNDRLRIVERRPATATATSHEFARDIRYVVGSGRHGYSFVAEHNGFLTMAPLGWFSEKQTWNLSPGYEKRNQRFDRAVPIECISCHNDVPVPVGHSPNRFEQPLARGISCERCHGAAQAHIAVQRGTAAAGTVDSIVNPMKLPSGQKDDLCLNCHLIAAVAVLADGRKWGDFQPGDKLRSHRRDFLLDAPADEFGFSSHAARLQLSKCWTADAAPDRLACAACHDVHKSLSDVPMQSYSQACLACHQGTDCSSQEVRDRMLSATTADNEVAGTLACASCHMSKRDTTDVAHTVFTDHRIAVPGSPITTSQRASIQAGEVGLVDFWEPPADEPSQKLALAQLSDIRGTPASHVVRDRLLDTLRDPKLEVATRARLQFWAATAEMKLGRWQQAQTLYALSAEHQQDALTLLSFAEACRHTGQFALAQQLLNRLLELDPQYLQAHKEMAETLAAAGDIRGAIDSLDRLLASYPYDGQAHVRRAQLGYLAGVRAAKVLDWVTRAKPLAPDSVLLYSVEGQCLSDLGKVDDAIRSFERALSIDPAHLPALLGLGPLLLQQQHWKQAEKVYETLAEMRPNDPNYSRTLTEIRTHLPSEQP